jgi:hypothetical protein
MIPSTSDDPLTWSFEEIRRRLEVRDPALMSAVRRTGGSIDEFRKPWYAQPGPQRALIDSDADEILYGGARGGGKSHGMLIDFLHHVEHSPLTRMHAKGLIVRRTLPELKYLIDLANEFYWDTGAVYRATEKEWRHPDGWFLKFAYLDRDQDADRYQGHEYTYVGIEEAGNFPLSSPIDKLRATLRSPHGIKVRMVMTANPGGPGHNWLKSRFIDPAPPYKIRKLKYRDSRTGTLMPWRLQYIPSRVEDNIVLQLRDPMYKVRIAQTGPKWLVTAWLSGDWDIVAGGKFDDLFVAEKKDRIILPWFRVPTHWRVDRAFDYGYTKPFSVGWWAESDGTPVTVPWQTEKLYLPRGSIVRIGEWYGWDGQPNQGVELTAKQIAEGIKERERRMGYHIEAGPADESIFHATEDVSIARKLEESGVRFISSGGNAIAGRIAGWDHMRSMLMASIADPREEPGMFIMDNCRQWIRTVPGLPRDQSKPDDVDTDAEDHIADETRYRCTVRKHTYRVRRVRI